MFSNSLLDALIAEAFRQEELGDMEALKKAERLLTAEDRQVLENLGDDFVERVTRKATRDETG